MKKYFYTITFSLLISTQIFGQCETNLHTPFFQDSWLSCEISNNPNPAREMSHWIQYDLGYQYVLDTIFLWNYNFWGYQGVGVRNLAIDYSRDGLNWTEAGVYEIAQASGSHQYEGIIGPILDDIQARFILMTVIDTWTNEVPCAGLSEVKFSLGQMTTSSEDIADDNGVIIAPNPATDMIQLTFQNLTPAREIVLLDVSGQMIRVINDTGEQSIEMSIDDLKPGVYLIQIAYADRKISTRFVKI